MRARSRRFAAKVARALLLGAAAGVAVASAPAAAQDIESPFRFLRGFPEIPLPTPQLLPDRETPEQARPSPEDAEPPQSGITGEANESVDPPGDEPLARDSGGPPESDDPDALPESAENPTDAADQPTAGADPAPADPDTAPEPETAATEPGAAEGSASLREDTAGQEAESGPPADSGTGQAAPGSAGSRDAGPGPSETLSSYSLRPFRLGVLAGRDARATMAALEPVSEGLRQALGRQVEILPMSSYRAMIDSQESQRIDGGFYSAEAYALAEADCRCLEPIVAPAAADGTAVYYAIIVASPESGISSVAGLDGKTVAMGAADSIGGRRMQIASLASEGFDLSASAASVLETASAAEAVRLVAEGEADAAFAWSSLEGELENGYSRGTLADLVASGGIVMDEIRVIWRSPAIPHGPVAVAKALPDEDKRRVESYLIGLNAAAPAAYDMLNPFYSGSYVAVEPEDYRGLDALAAVDADSVELSRDSASEAGGVAD